MSCRPGNYTGNRTGRVFRQSLPMEQMGIVSAATRSWSYSETLMSAAPPLRTPSGAPLSRPRPSTARQGTSSPFGLRAPTPRFPDDAQDSCDEPRVIAPRRRWHVQLSPDVKVAAAPCRVSCRVSPSSGRVRGSPHHAALAARCASASRPSWTGRNSSYWARP